MHSVKVRRSGITAEEVAKEIRGGLGDGCQVETAGSDRVNVRKSYFSRARVALRSEPGGTVFEVRGEGVPIPVPFVHLTTRLMNDGGIARRIAGALEGSESFRDNS